jgi:hypothetical protein
MSLLCPSFMRSPLWRFLKERGPDHGLPKSSWCDKNAVSFQLSGAARDGGIGRHAWHSKYWPERHNFQKDVPSIEAGAGVIDSNFVDLRSGIAGGGPISIDPEVQNVGVGRRLTDSGLLPCCRCTVAGASVTPRGAQRDAQR